MKSPHNIKTDFWATDPIIISSHKHTYSGYSHYFIYIIPHGIPFFIQETRDKDMQVQTKLHLNHLLFIYVKMITHIIYPVAELATKSTWVKDI